MEQKEYERIQAMTPAEFGKLDDDTKFAVVQHARELLNASSRLSSLAQKLADDSNAKTILLDKQKKLQVASMVTRKLERISAMKDEIAEIESDIDEIRKQFVNVENWRKTFADEISALFKSRKEAREARKLARVKAKEALIKELQELATGMIAKV